jgi:polyketide synthase 3/4
MAPHPLLTHAVQQNASSLDMPIAALAAMRREQELPNGLRGFVANVFAAGAAVDFAAMYPDGRLVDAPLATWTHRALMLTREGQDQQSHGASLQAVHPLLGAHVHLFEEPERHVWQGEVGTVAHPWLEDHQIHGVPALPGAAYCEMALAASFITLGEGAEVRDVRFEQTLLLAGETSVSSSAAVVSPGVFDFSVETHQDGERVRRASAVLHAAEGVTQQPTHDIAALVAAHPSSLDGVELRKAYDSVGIQYGPAFGGLVAANTAEGEITTVLAEVALPGLIRSQQAAYGSHPALLDACFQSVIVHPEVQSAAAGGGMLLPVGVRRLRCHQPTRNAHYCLVRVVASRPGECEADLEVMDHNGVVLMTVEGLRLAGGGSERDRADRVLNERLLTIEWEPQELSDDTSADAMSWVVLDTAAKPDALATDLTGELTAAGTRCVAVSWPLGAEHPADGVPLESHFATAGATESGPTGVVVVLGGSDDDSPEPLVRRGRDQVNHLVGIARVLAELPGGAPRLYVVTRAAASVLAGDMANLEQTGLRGLMRVIDSEYPHLSVTQIDVDDEQQVGQRVARQLLSGSAEDETAWRGGQWHTARLRSSPLLPDERRTTVVDHDDDGMRMEIRTPGDLQSMEFVAFDRIPPGPGQIEVAVTASSVNFADVLVTFGRYPSFEGHLPKLGTDFAGVVTAVGPDVTQHRVGDHVGGMSPNGCWSTFVTCDARLTAAIPAGLSDGQAAAVTTAHATAWHALNDLAKVTSSDKVLIHSGTGGVGQAAIAMARAAGAEVFATAGSPERRQLLRDMGIEHVYDSRSTDFADEIRSDTAGYGVDVVLNSLPGAAQSAGLELLSFGGRFIEIGKRDIYGDTRLGLFPFRRNLTFYAVDLGLMGITHPDEVHRLLGRVYGLTADGSLPMPTSTHHPLADAAAAVRLVGGAGHTGKVVLDVPRTGRSVAAVPPADVRVFRPDGAYVVTGGVGGLGLFLASEMAAAGCGRIVLNSRSAPNAEAQEAIETIRATGVDVQVELGDVSDPETAERLVAVATETGLPVRGVLHGAAVVEDATLINVSSDVVDHCWTPKVNGAWNMHHATATQPLDWFCSFSSAAALVGSPGQGAYAAANSWLDAFSHWRRAQGLPSTAIAWGAWAEVGRATALAEALAEEAGAAIKPAEGFAAFKALLSHDRPYSGYAPISGTPWLTAFAQRSKFASAFQASAKGQSDKGKFRAELASLPREEWPSAIRRLVSDQISLLLRRTIDPDRPLSEYGLDSLGNLELRTRIETETGIRISPTHITTVRGLAEHLCDQLEAIELAPAAS